MEISSTSSCRDSLPRRWCTLLGKFECCVPCWTLKGEGRDPIFSIFISMSEKARIPHGYLMEFTWKNALHFGYFGVNPLFMLKKHGHLVVAWRWIHPHLPWSHGFGSGRSWRAMLLGRTPSSLGMLSSRPARGTEAPRNMMVSLGLLPS